MPLALLSYLKQQIKTKASQRGEDSLMMTPAGSMQPSLMCRAWSVLHGQPGMNFKVHERSLALTCRLQPASSSAKCRPLLVCSRMPYTAFGFSCCQAQDTMRGAGLTEMCLGGVAKSNRYVVHQKPASMAASQFLVVWLSCKYVHAAAVALAELSEASLK